MASDDSSSRFREIDASLGLHEIESSVRQLTYMKIHCETLLASLKSKLAITYTKAPLGRLKKRQSYELDRTEKPDPQERERFLEKKLWAQWSYREDRINGPTFYSDVCRFIKSFQMPLRGANTDTKWGMIDLIGVTSNALPAVIELKQESAKDTPLRMLVEGVAYACAVRKAWNWGILRREWINATTGIATSVECPVVLSNVPVILLAPSEFWRAKIGLPGRRSEGKVFEDAWPPFFDLAKQCGDHGMPIHFAEFDGGDDGLSIRQVRF